MPTNALGKITVSCIFALLTVSCGGSESNDGPLPRPEDGSNGKPVILSVSSNTVVMQKSWSRESGSGSAKNDLLLHVVATDPDGIEDLIGGEILGSVDMQTSSFTQGVYKSLSIAGDEGTYSATLSWDELNALNSIHSASEEGITIGEGFSVPPSLEDATTMRMFSLVLYDSVGNFNQAFYQVLLQCEPEGPLYSSEQIALCDGDCVDLQSDPMNCGECGNTCLESQTCGNGSCY